MLLTKLDILILLSVLEETNVPVHLRILLSAIGAVCCVRSQRRAVTLCVSASQVLILVESHYVNGLWLSRTISQNFVWSSLRHTRLPSPRDLDLPLNRELFVFRCSSRHDIHPRVLRCCGITHDAGTVLICYITDAGFNLSTKIQIAFLLYMEGKTKSNTDAFLAKNMVLHS